MHFFQVPFWVTPFIVPVMGRTKVGDQFLVHLTMLTLQQIFQKYQKVIKKQQKIT